MAYRYGVTDYMSKYIKDNIFPEIDKKLNILSQSNDFESTKEYDELFKNRMKIEKLIKSGWFDQQMEKYAYYAASKYGLKNEEDDIIQFFIMRNFLGKNVSNIMNTNKDLSQDVNKIKPIDWSDLFKRQNNDLSEITATDIMKLFNKVSNMGMKNIANIMRRNMKEHYSINDLQDEDERGFDLEDPKSRTPLEELSESEELFCDKPGAFNEMLLDLKLYVHKQILRTDRELQPILESIFDIWLDIIKKGQGGGGWNEILRKITKDADVQDKIKNCTSRRCQHEDIENVARSLNRTYISNFVQDFFKKEMDAKERECWENKLKMHMTGVKAASNKLISKYRYLVAAYILGKENNINFGKFKSPEKMAEEILEEQEKRKQLASELIKIASLIGE